MLELQHLEEVNTKLRERITQSEENLRKANSHKANHEKNIIILKKLEKEVIKLILLYLL